MLSSPSRSPHYRAMSAEPGRTHARTTTRTPKLDTETPMRKPATALLATALAFAVAVPTANAGTRTIRLGDDWFVRDSGSTRVSVDRGTRARWRWTGNDLHNVVVRRGPVRFQSALKRSGSYSK